MRNWTKSREGVSLEYDLKKLDRRNKKYSRQMNMCRGLGRREHGEQRLKECSLAGTKTAGEESRRQITGG